MRAFSRSESIVACPGKVIHATLSAVEDFVAPMVIRYPRFLIVALLAASGSLVGCGAATSPTEVVTATLAVESIEAIRELTAEGSHLYHASFELRETQGKTGATVKAVDLQFHNGYTATFGADAVPHVGAGRTVVSKKLSTADPDRTRTPAINVQVRVLSTDDKGTDSVSVATKAILSAFVLSGIVTEANTGRPIGGATVRITFGPDAGRSTTTNANGRYTFNTIVQGPISFTVNASGHATHTKTVDVQADTRLDVALIRS